MIDGNDDEHADANVDPSKADADADADADPSKADFDDHDVAAVADANDGDVGEHVDGNVDGKVAQRGRMQPVHICDQLLGGSRCIVWEVLKLELRLSHG